MSFSNLSISKKMYFGFGLIVAAFTLLVGLAYDNFRQLGQANNWNIHTYEVLGEVDSILESLINMETGERGFALTGNEASLEPYNAGRDAFARHWENARRLTADNPQQQSRLQALREMQQQWQKDAVEPVLAMRRRVSAGQDKVDSVLAYEQSAKGKQAMDAMRSRLDDIAGAERKLLEKRSAEVLTLDSRMGHTLLFGGLAAIAAAILIAHATAQSMIRPLRQVLRATEDLRDGNGDLTYRLPAMNAEFGQLAESLNGFIGKLHDVIAGVRDSAQLIAAASKQIAAGNFDLSSRTEQQASSLEETAASMEEITGTVKQNAENARQATSLASDASEMAISGGVAVNQVVDNMALIDQSAQKIADIITVIDGIAFQTNILALNAAVEAARAGEQGRGFAVVATEVRGLAQRSAAAAKEIKVLITDSVEKVGAGTKLVNEAGSKMKDIVDGVRGLTDIVRNISVASAEQTSGIEQVNQALSQMDGVTQQNAALVEEVASGSKELSNEAGQLLNLISEFRLERTAAPDKPERPPQLDASVSPMALRGNAVPARRMAVAAEPRKSLPSRTTAKAGEGWEEF